VRTRTLAAITLFIAATACGGDDHPGGTDAPPATDGPGGLCAGRPCRTSITTEADWAAVSAPHTSRRCELTEDSKYLAPATASAALQEVVFQDVKAHRFHLDFMTQALPEIFGGLSPQQYQAMVQRRATRQYWAGALYRIVDVNGTTTGYGFDIIVDPTLWEEHATEDEVLAIKALLEAQFHLPLVYAPTEPEAVYRSYDFERVEHLVPRACEVIACTDPSSDCVDVPTPVELCAHFMEGRTIAVEHARKARLSAVPGEYVLPRTVGTHTVPAIFGSGTFGPERLAIAPAGTTGLYEVTDIGQFRQRRYRQTFTVGGTRSMELSWEIRLPAEGGGFLLAEPHIFDHVWASATLDGSQQWEDMMQLSTCTGETLDPYRISGTIGGAGGGSFRIDFRYLPPAAGSGPVFPTSAQVTLGGATTNVNDYFRIVYAGEHHNWNNQHWILFGAPVTYAGHDIYGVWLDEEPYQWRLESAFTLGPLLQPLDPLVITDYTVGPAN
jgi:hypothetical protein